MTGKIKLDALIVGGGIAGLWVVQLLKQKGYQVALIEAEQLGVGQTLASQGMIHGGLKYALGGALTGASEAIADMPARWRRCIAGQGEVDLTGLRILSEHNLLFADASSLGRLTTFFASRTLRGRLQRVARADWPLALEGCGGWVYRLDDLVVDTSDLIARLAKPLTGQLYQHQLSPEQLTACSSGWRVNLPEQELFCDRLILCAGAGNEQLLACLGQDAPVMQRRPLRQVIVRSSKLSPLYGHCLTGIQQAEPRLTISAHPDADGWLWYLGGQIASRGASMNDNEFVIYARAELSACLPWLDLGDAEITTLAIDRAEVACAERRPDAAFASRCGDSIVCWPTKLSLAPDLGDRVLALMPEPSSSCHDDVATDVAIEAIRLPGAIAGEAPWS